MIPVTKLSLGEAEADAAARVIRSGWVAQGPQVEAFERSVAAFVGASHAVAVSSGTAALHLCLEALGVGPGHEVLVPSLSFVATANTVVQTGATPVFVDLDPATYNIDPTAAEAAITERTRAIMPVHQVGLPADLATIDDLAARHGLLVVEDAACSLGATFRGHPIGGDRSSSAAARCFSFHPRKIITTGEGGMITTADGDLAQRLRVLRSQGMSVSARQRHEAAGPVFEEFGDLGYNYRLTDIQAAVGVEQMKRLPGLIDQRRRLGARYGRLLAHLPGVTPPAEPDDRRHTYQSYMVLLDREVERDRVLGKLNGDEVGAKRSVGAIHLEPLYRDRQPGLSLPVTEDLFARGLILPLYPGMTDDEQDRVVASLERALAASDGS